MITVTRRAGCLIPTRRVIRCQEKLEKWGRQQIDTLKDLKSKINVGSCIQIVIWLHFRIERDVKHMPAGRNISSIDFIGVETPDKDRSSELKKLKKWENKMKICIIFSIMSFRMRYQDVQQVSCSSAGECTHTKYEKHPKPIQSHPNLCKIVARQIFLCVKMLSITRHVAPSPRRGRCSAPPTLIIRWIFYRSFS